LQRGKLYINNLIVKIFLCKISKSVKIIVIESLTTYFIFITH